MITIIIFSLPDLKDLYSHTIDRVSEARKHLLGKKVSEPTKKDQGKSPCI